MVSSWEQTTGTDIANKIIENFKREKGQALDFKNVQWRVYDALNVFSALNIISKERNKICYLDESNHLYPTNVTIEAGYFQDETALKCEEREVDHDRLSQGDRPADKSNQEAKVSSDDRAEQLK